MFVVERVERAPLDLVVLLVHKVHPAHQEEMDLMAHLDHKETMEVLAHRDHLDQTVILVFLEKLDPSGLQATLALVVEREHQAQRDQQDLEGQKDLLVPQESWQPPDSLVDKVHQGPQDHQDLPASRATQVPKASLPHQEVMQIIVRAHVDTEPFKTFF